MSMCMRMGMSMSNLIVVIVIVRDIHNSVMILIDRLPLLNIMCISLTAIRRIVLIIHMGLLVITLLLSLGSLLRSSCVLLLLIIILSMLLFGAIRPSGASDCEDVGGASSGSTLR